MNVLVLNTGSSSLKYRLFRMPDRRALCAGLVERIGDTRSAVRHVALPGSAQERRVDLEREIVDHEAALHLVLGMLTNEDSGVIRSKKEIDAVGHRVVHGGERFREPTLVDDDVIEAIASFVTLAPLHNPAGLISIEAATKLFPGVPNVAVFDTAFHGTIPEHAYLFPVPMDLYTDLGVRRYGFHGTSHKYVSGRAAQLLDNPDPCRVITVHLGNGCSMAAVKNGRCLDTSMGLTPLMGLMMGTRSGDVDPALHAFLARTRGWSLEEIDNVLNKASGLKGICGVADMRDLHELRAGGDARAELALEMFCHRVRHYIGAYMATLGGLDAVVFTAGIGENDPEVRLRCCRGLDDLGIILDEHANRSLKPGSEAAISAPDSRASVFVIPTNEELEIAAQTHGLLKA